MTNSNLQRFEQSVRQTGDVDASLAEMAAGAAPPDGQDPASIDARLRAAALRALAEEPVASQPGEIGN